MDNEINNLIVHLDELEDALLIGMLKQKLSDLKKKSIPEPILTEHDYKCAKVGMMRILVYTLGKATGRNINTSVLRHNFYLYEECEKILEDPRLLDIIKLKTLVNKMKRKLLNINLKQNETS